MKQVAGAYKIELAQYFELQAFSQFAADIGPETQARLARGVRLVALLGQCAGNPVSTRQQVRALCLAHQGFLCAAGTQELKGLSLLALGVPEWVSVVLSPKPICASSARAGIRSCWRLDCASAGVRFLLRSALSNFVRAAETGRGWRFRVFDLFRRRQRALRGPLHGRLAQKRSLCVRRLVRGGALSVRLSLPRRLVYRYSLCVKLVHARLSQQLH